MPMEKRFCPSCKQTKWHNQAKKEGTEFRWRCTYCGYPVTTRGDKADVQRALMEQQVRKVQAK